jgi:2-polyprenyl-3-methyl-5-hydroxy-6-metoxy-1,4-benzoquinol methylase
MQSQSKSRAEPNTAWIESSSMAVNSYDRHYFAHYCDATKSGKLAYERNAHWLGFFGKIADHIVSDINPRTVLDAGCAMGFLVEALRDREVEAFGIDISDYAISQVRSDIKPYCRQGSVTQPLSDRYDLIVSIEVLEHLPTEDAIVAVSSLCAATNDFLFSSTPTDYQEITHLNVQPPEWWAELFGRQSFFRDVEYDPSTYVSPWAVRFRRSEEPAARIVAGYERLASRLKTENRTLRQVASEQRAQLDRYEEMAAGVSAPRLLARSLFPADTSRGKMLRRVLKRSS